jgi:hypothetical protein
LFFFERNDLTACDQTINASVRSRRAEVVDDDVKNGE